MGSIVWNGISSRTIPLIIENPPHYVSAEREYEPQHVPGRNGDLLIASDSFKNVERSYDVAFGSLEKPASELAAATSEWLRSANGYARLEDTYDHDYYRMAYYQQESDFEDILGHLGRGTITFNCMPQRFLKSGDTLLTFDLNGVGNSQRHFPIWNPTYFPSRPDIYIYGKGNITIMTHSGDITIKNITESVKIDGERRGVYFPTIHYAGEPPVWDGWAGDLVDLSDSHNPTNMLLKPQDDYGVYVTVKSGTFTKMEVAPKWYTI